MKKLVIRQVRSSIGQPEKHRRVLAGLGLRKLHRPVFHYASPQIMGMLNKVCHLVVWEERSS